MMIIMVALITVCQAECECQSNENEKSAVQASRVDRAKCDRVLAQIYSPSISKDKKIFGFEYERHHAANNSQ
jgi:hypothetical protein